MLPQGNPDRFSHICHILSVSFSIVLRDPSIACKRDDGNLYVDGWMDMCMHGEAKTSVEAIL